MFFSGQAGTGKSFLFTKIFNEKSRFKKVLRLAPTGVAAINIEGVTIDRFLELNKHNNNRIHKVQYDVIMIDEISMVQTSQFDALSTIFKKLKGNNKPFGGVQLIVFGDFFQLPPPTLDTFCFSCKEWGQIFNKTNFIELNKNKRQSNDHEFFDILGDIRVGRVVDEKRLQKAMIPRKEMTQYIFDNNTVILVYRNDTASRINKQYIEHVDGESYRFDVVEIQPSIAKKLYKNATLREERQESKELILKVNARVMVTHNINVEEGVCNGAMGCVVGFTDNKTPLPIIRLDGKGKIITLKHCVFKQNNKVVAKIPLVLAKAITIHKSQGQTLSRVVCDIDGIKQASLAYVAISRVKTLQDLKIVSTNGSIPWMKADPKVIEFYDSLKNL